MEVTYEATRIEAKHADILRDLNTQGKTWMIVRTSPISQKAWSFHTSEATARAAKRRWEAREVVTR